MLASDGERDATIARLRAAHVAGRIDAAEFEARVGRAQTARGRADLDALLADLPPGETDLAPTRGVPRLPGRRHFEVRRLVAGPPEAVRLRLEPALERHGFYVHREEGGTLAFAHRREMASRLKLRLHEAPGGTLVDVHGYAPLTVRRLLATLH